MDEESAVRAVEQADGQVFDSLQIKPINVLHKVGSKYFTPRGNWPKWSPGHKYESMNQGPPPISHGPPTTGMHPGPHVHPTGSFGPTGIAELSHHPFAAMTSRPVWYTSRYEIPPMSEAVATPREEERLVESSRSSSGAQGYYTPPEHPGPQVDDDDDIYNATPRPTLAKPFVENDDDNSEVYSDTILIRRPDTSRRLRLPHVWGNELSETQPKVRDYPYTETGKPVGSSTRQAWLLRPGTEGNANVDVQAPVDPKYDDAQDEPTMLDKDQGSDSSRQYATASSYQSPEPSPSIPITVRLPPSGGFPPVATYPPNVTDPIDREQTQGETQQDKGKGGQSGSEPQAPRDGKSGKKSRRNSKAQSSQAREYQEPSGGTDHAGQEESGGRNGRGRRRSTIVYNPVPYQTTQPTTGPTPRPQQPTMMTPAQPLVNQPFSSHPYGANPYGVHPFATQPHAPQAFAPQHFIPEYELSTPRRFNQEEANLINEEFAERMRRYHAVMMGAVIHHRQMHGPMALTRGGSRLPFPESTRTPIFPTDLTGSPLPPGEARSRSRGPPHVTPSSRPGSKSPDKVKLPEKPESPPKEESPDKSKKSDQSESPVKAEHKFAEKPAPESGDPKSSLGGDNEPSEDKQQGKGKRRYIKNIKAKKAQAQSKPQHPTTESAEPVEATKTQIKTPVVPAATLALIDQTAVPPERPSRDGPFHRGGGQRGRGKAGRKPRGTTVTSRTSQPQEPDRPRGPWGATMPMLTSADFPNPVNVPKLRDSQKPETSAWSRGPPSFAANAAGSRTGPQAGNVSAPRPGSQVAGRNVTALPAQVSNLAVAGTARPPQMASGNVGSPAAQTSERETPKPNAAKAAGGKGKKKENKKPATDDRKGG
ncbi:hypothetical protein GGS26DRAFT_528748 [Hypomontagnella submonticulosa]|nr:hypothetical protein GGS26DRAFT_528748 [Hypomontagnella submonticulosa]